MNSTWSEIKTADAAKNCGKDDMHESVWGLLVGCVHLFKPKQTVGERVCAEGPCYLSEQPWRSPRGAALRNKNSMCGTLRVCGFGVSVHAFLCVCVCVCTEVLETELSWNSGLV